jgi:site-specific recombinase XerD
MPGHHRGRCPRNKGRHYPADPPTTEEIIAVMRRAGAAPYGLRARALVVLLWRAGLRVSEALALAESDLDHSTGGVLVRLGKGGKRRHVGMDRWGWQQLQPWLDRRIQLPVGALLCVIDGPTAGRPWSPSAARTTLHRLAVEVGVRRRFAPHQLRHAHAVEIAREGIPLTVIQRQLGHANLGVTSVHLQASTRARSSTPSTADPRRRCLLAPLCADPPRLGGSVCAPGLPRRGSRHGSLESIAYRTQPTPQSRFTSPRTHDRSASGRF